MQFTLTRQHWRFIVEIQAFLPWKVGCQLVRGQVIAVVEGVEKVLKTPFIVGYICFQKDKDRLAAKREADG
jgi:hypothetical protein